MVSRPSLRQPPTLSSPRTPRVSNITSTAHTFTSKSMLMYLSFSLPLFLLLTYSFVDHVVCCESNVSTRRSVPLDSDQCPQLHYPGLVHDMCQYLNHTNPKRYQPLTSRVSSLSSLCLSPTHTGSYPRFLHFIVLHLY